MTLILREGQESLILNLKESCLGLVLDIFERVFEFEGVLSRSGSRHDWNEPLNLKGPCLGLVLDII